MTTPAPGALPAAQPAAPSAEPSDEQREKAREAYARGQALFTEGKFQEAEAAFNEAYAAVPNPVVLLSTAECEVRLGKFDDAYTAFNTYLKARPDAPDRSEVEKKAAELLALPATIVLSSEPAGAAIKLDGVDSGKLTNAELSVARGTHAIELKLGGYQVTSEPLETRIGARYELHVVLKPVEKPKAVPPPADLKVKPEVQPSDPTTALWVTSIVGAAGLVTGTVLGFIVLAERSDYDAKPTESAAKRGERLALFTDVAFGMGAMALVTGAVLYFTSDHEETPPAATKASLGLSPVTFGHGAGLSAHGRF